MITGHLHYFTVLRAINPSRTNTGTQISDLKSISLWTTVYGRTQLPRMHPKRTKFAVEDGRVVGVSWISVRMKRMSIISMEEHVKVIWQQNHPCKYRSCIAWSASICLVLCWMTIWSTLLFDNWSQMMCWLLSKTISCLPTPRLTLRCHRCYLMNLSWVHSLDK